LKEWSKKLETDTLPDTCDNATLQSSSRSYSTL
jgi:hypothetical protein